MKHILAAIVVFCLLNSGISRAASNISKTRFETVIMKVGVTPFSISGPPATSRTLQDYILRLLKEQSYLNCLPSAEVSITTPDNAVIAAAKKYRVHGFLVGRWEKGVLEYSIRSGFTGRTVGRWAQPFKGPVDEKEMAQLVSKNIVSDFPYRGYIYQIKGKQITLNLGSVQAIKVGDKLDVFDFEGSRPTFTSSRDSIGQVEVVSIQGNSVIAKATKGESDLAPFQKIGFPEIALEKVQETALGPSKNKIWVSVGPDFFFLDTKTSASSGNISKRIYQVPLSPFLGLGAGFGPIKVLGTLGSASNASNNVKFTQANGSLRLFSSTPNIWTHSGSIGVLYSRYAATPKEAAELPLSSVTTFSPYFEYRLDKPLGNDYSIWVAGQGFYGVYSSDNEGVVSSPVTSFGAGANTGVRLDLSDHFGIEAGLRGHGIRQQMTEGTSAIEIQYGFFLRGLLMF